MSWSASLPADTSLIRVSAGYIRANESSVQSVLTSSNLTNEYPYIPTATPVYFYLDSGSVPSGWSLYNSLSDCLLAIQGGSSAYNVTGGSGSTVGTWNGPAYALIANQLPNLSSTVTTYSGNGPGAFFSNSDGTGGSANLTITVNSGGGMTHEHDWTTTRPTAAVGNLYTKNS